MLTWVIGGIIAFLLFCMLIMLVCIYNMVERLEKITNHTDALVYEMRQDQLGHRSIYSSRIGDN